jgi:dCMP deaminase
MTDLDYLREAYRVAEAFSTDPSTQNGAILVHPGNGLTLASAANRFPRGVVMTPDRLERPKKYEYFVHAEAGVLLRAAAIMAPTQGSVMYCCWAPCGQCAGAIIEAGVRELVTHDLPQHKDRADWIDIVRLGIEMLNEAGVGYRCIPGKIGGVKIRFGGVEVEP